MSSAPNPFSRLVRPYDHAKGASGAPLTLKQSTLALLIGLMALLIPVLPPLVTALIGVCQQDSISDYFYGPFAGGCLSPCWALSGW